MATLRDVLMGIQAYEPLAYNGSQGGYNRDMILRELAEKDLDREVVYHEGGYHYANAEGHPVPHLVFRYYEMSDDEAREAYRR